MSDKRLGYPLLILLIVVMTGTWIYVAHVLSIAPIFRVIRFEQVGNLRIDDPVKIQGITVGTVAAVTPVADEVAVTVRVYEPFDVHPGYLVRNADRGMMGDRGITIETGDHTLPPLSPDDTLSGLFYPGISEWVGQAWKLARAVDSLSRMSTLLLAGDDRHSPFADQFKSVVGTTTALSDRLLRLARAGHRHIGPQLDTLSRILEATERVVRAVAALSPEYLDKIDEGLTQLEVFVARLEEAIAGLTQLVEVLEDPESVLWSERLLALADNVKELRFLIDEITEGAVKLKLQISRLKE